jgi:hypothetical protein
MYLLWSKSASMQENLPQVPCKGNIGDLGQKKGASVMIMTKVISSKLNVSDLDQAYYWQ